MSATVPIRLRGPNGLSTLQVDLDAAITVLQNQIFSATEIPPSSQDLKTGYPPTSLTLTPSLPISSLGLKRGDQLIVAKASGLLNPVPTFQNHSADILNSSTAVRSPAISAARAPTPIVSNVGIEQLEQSPEEVEDSIDVDGSVLVFRVVPDDNSCLFSSIAIVFLQDIKAASSMRQLVASAIRRNPEKYNEAILGQAPEQYIATILKPTSWGGAIELSVFSEHFQTEISSFDVETGRCDRFGEGLYDNRCILMYSGIHYDAVSLAPARNAPLDFHQTIYPVNASSILEAGGKLAEQRRAKKAFTNTSTFDLRCQVCGKGLKGEKGAREHAKETGHVEFGEY